MWSSRYGSEYWGSRSLPGGISGRWNWRQWKRRRFIGSWPDSFPAEDGSSFGICTIRRWRCLPVCGGSGGCPAVGAENRADRRSGGAGSEGAGKAVSLRPACSDGVYGADGGRGFRHCVPAPCGFEPGGVRSAGPSAGGTGAEHFTIIGKKTKPGHDPPQGSHVPFFGQS